MGSAIAQAVARINAVRSQTATRPPRWTEPQALKARLAVASRLAPITGPSLDYAVPIHDHATACTQWLVRSQSRYVSPFTAAGAI